MKNLELFEIYTANHEYKNIITDKYNRTPHFIGKNNVLDPCLSEFLVQNGLEISYPNNKSFAAIISHDIDYLYQPLWSLKTLLNQQSKSILSRNFKQLLPNFKNLQRKISPLYSIENILRVNNKYNINSTFYFLALNEEDEDFNYSLSEVKSFTERLKKRGDKIGLHGGHLAYNSKEKICLEKEYLNKKLGLNVNSYRNHYMRFDIKSTWDQLIKSGFKIDSTFGYHNIPGFRNGMCHPFIPYSVNNNSFLDIIEIPIMIMDTTLFKHLNLNHDNAFELVKIIIDKVKKLNGVVTILWHNESFTGKHLELYTRILDYLIEQDCWIAKEDDLLNHYEKNSYFKEMKKILQNSFSLDNSAHI